MYERKTFDQFAVGQKGVFTKTVTEADVINFAGTSGDFNPIHMNEEYAKTTQFGGRIAHGMLVASFLSAAGAQFTGLASIYIGHTHKFLAPVKIGDTITATMEIIDLVPEKKILKLRSYCTNQDGKVVIDGEASVKIIA